MKKIVLCFGLMFCEIAFCSIDATDWRYISGDNEQQFYADTSSIRYYRNSEGDFMVSILTKNESSETDRFCKSMDSTLKNKKPSVCYIVDEYTINCNKAMYKLDGSYFFNSNYGDLSMRPHSRPRMANQSIFAPIKKGRVGEFVHVFACARGSIKESIQQSEAKKGATNDF